MLAVPSPSHQIDNPVVLKAFEMIKIEGVRTRNKGLIATNWSRLPLTRERVSVPRRKTKYSKDLLLNMF